MLKLAKYLALGAVFFATPLAAQTIEQVNSDAELTITTEQAFSAFPNQEHCIAVMAGFPNEGYVPRYQFFKLSEELARGATYDFRSVLQKYGSGDVSPNTPILDVIEIVANPVLRQAAPELTVAHMGFLINFASDCKPFLIGQIESLRAYDNSLSHTEFNAVISEDALYLRQILSDVLFRLGADQDDLYAETVLSYAQNLVTTRDAIEFASFEAELEDLEAAYLVDLDGRLKRSNDVINENMDTETLANSVAITDDMNSEARKKRKRNALQTLADILNRY